MNDSTIELSPKEETIIFLRMVARQMQTADYPTS